MAMFIVLALMIVGLGIATALGWTADSRDPDYGLGRVLRDTRTGAGITLDR